MSFARRAEQIALTSDKHHLRGPGVAPEAAGSSYAARLAADGTMMQSGTLSPLAYGTAEVPGLPPRPPHEHAAYGVPSGTSSAAAYAPVGEDATFSPPAELRADGAYIYPESVSYTHLTLPTTPYV
mgnify:CR=1 FL=1